MSAVLGGCPAALGFRMPAEWEQHAATWMIWPHNRDDWDVKSNAAEWCYVEIIRHLVRYERVALICQNKSVRQRAEARLARAGVERSVYDTYTVKTNRSWIRDSGPIFLVSAKTSGRKVALTDWEFTGWGRYRSYREDNRVPRVIADRLGVSRFLVRVGKNGREENVVLEGGSIDVNGCGDLLTTEQCLLGVVQSRNPGLSREALETVLRSYLGVRRVHWLIGGIDGDDTNGHVDDVARFVTPNTIVAAEEADNSDINYVVLQRNLDKLRNMRTASGGKFGVVSIPMPKPVWFDGVRLPASYLNFYIGNDVVLVPTFHDSRDREALAVLAQVFPTREVVGIYAGDLILGLGAIHCLTQQQPVGDYWDRRDVSSGA